MSGDVFVNHSRVDCFECMREAILGSHVDVTQLAPGALQGWLTHNAIGEFSLSAGSFSVGIRAQRTSNEKHLIIGILLLLIALLGVGGVIKALGSVAWILLIIAIIVIAWRVITGRRPV